MQERHQEVSKVVSHTRSGRKFTKCILSSKYRILPNYRIYSYKRTVKQFRSLQITASVLFVFFFMKVCVFGTHLNCIDAVQMNIHNICCFVVVVVVFVFVLKKIRKTHINIIK